MGLSSELDRLDRCYIELRQVSTDLLRGRGSPIYVMDFIAIGAIKRSLSLASGMGAMVRAKNMTCSRALLRMHLDTVSRLLAYSYVDNPEAVARAVIGGTPLKKVKSSDGNWLSDGYLIRRLSETHSWVERVYQATSGYIHFSERQFFDSIQKLGGDEDRTFELRISDADENFPEFSWAEAVACFNDLTGILRSTLHLYSNAKARPSEEANATSGT